VLILCYVVLFAYNYYFGGKIQIALIQRDFFKDKAKTVKVRRVNSVKILTVSLLAWERTFLGGYNHGKAKTKV